MIIKKAHVKNKKKTDFTKYLPNRNNETRLTPAVFNNNLQFFFNTFVQKE